MVELGGDILRGLQSFLHLLRVFIDAHTQSSERRPAANWLSQSGSVFPNYVCDDSATMFVKSFID
jgi:hypothetical protein